MSASESFKKAWSEIERDSAKQGNNTANNWQQSAEKMNTIANKGLKGIGIAIAGVGTAMGTIGGFALKTGVDFESAFTGVKKTVDGTDQQFAQLEKAIRNMAKSMPESASEIAGVAEAAGQLGIKVENIEGFTKSMVMLGDSTNMSSEEAATALARLANITQMPQTEFDRLGSVIVALGNNLATTESEITAMGLRLAGAGHQVGMSEAQIMSFAGALSSVGIEAEAGGSAFSKVMVDMQLAVEKGGEGLNQFAKVAGMSSSEFQKAFKEDAAGAIIAFIQGLGKCQESGQSAIGVLDNMGITEVRMRDALLRAAGAGNVFTDALELGTKAWDENIALTKEAETRYATTESKMEMIKNQIVDLGITMFEKFKKPFGEALDSVMQSLEKLSNSLANGALGESVDKIAVSFGKLIEKLSESVTNWLPKIIDALAWIMDNASFIASGIAGIGTALMVLNVANMIMGLVEAFKAFKAANEGATVAQWLLNAAMAANPIGLVVSIIAGLIAGIIVLWNTNEDFRNAVIDAWNAILGAAQAVWGAIVDFFTVDIPAAWQSLLDFFNGVPGWFADLWTTIQQAFVDGWNAIVNFFTQTIPQWISSVGEWFNELPHLIGYALGYALGTIVKWGVDTWNYLVTNVPIWINNVVNFFATLPGRIWTWLVNTINRIVNWGQQTYTNMVNAATRAINATIQWFATLPGRIWTWLVNTISRVAEFAVNLASRARDAGANMVTNIVEAVRNLPSRFLEIGRNIVEGVWNGITGMAGWIRDRVNGFFSGIVDGAKDALGIHSPSRVFRDQVGKYMAQGVGVGFENETDNIKRSMQKDLSNLTTKMKTTVDFETSRTSRAMTAGVNKTINNTNETVTNNDNGLTLKVDKFINNTKQDIKDIAEELEFYRKRNSLATGGV
ncbi:phage tail tape measure protein [Clostridium botulinum]|uniref:Phage tail tape measure protein n=2 Tax=Clostridium botulinum TaxID=1491 RepID=A0A6G4CRY0_CLOBO|nr:phage tail tape measure protein [Clostridium botulinum]MBY7011132.1 phage tail tape measure protein [Clostridium botulinum]MCS6165680.1 phage tail tape measure protein [Clostridium botulinum]NEZ76235.1 phage tail tape measure protein [Clostridium botulinum]NFA00829.1 phage tail tape measure protein [Clostridium botulinum]